LKVRWAAGLAALAVLAGGHSASRPMTAERLAAADALSAYACVLKSQGRFEEGLGVIQRAHALAPESAKITAEVGFHLHAAGHFDAEFPMLYRAVRLDDRSPDAWLHLGLAHARREDFAKAVEALERARALAGDNRRVQDWLTWARQRQEASRQQAAAEAAFR
jgi:tetratricopeptide (TPR) repeat protein